MGNNFKSLLTNYIMHSPHSRKAPVHKVIQISHRLYNQGQRDLQKRKHLLKTEERVNPQVCTFKPNIKKSKFVKYPNPPLIKKHDDVILQPNILSHHQKQRNIKEMNPPKRLGLYYKWQQKRKLRIMNDFLQDQIRKSLQHQSVSKSPHRHRENYKAILSRSVDHEGTGVEQFYARLNMARLKREEKEFLYKNPTAHTWNFTSKTDSKTDALLTNYMDLGGDDYSRGGLCLSYR